MILQREYAYHASFWKNQILRRAVIRRRSNCASELKVTRRMFLSLYHLHQTKSWASTHYKGVLDLELWNDDHSTTHI